MSKKDHLANSLNYVLVVILDAMRQQTEICTTFLMKESISLTVSMEGLIYPIQVILESAIENGDTKKNQLGSILSSFSLSETSQKSFYPLYIIKIIRQSCTEWYHEVEIII